jgi:antitoxin component of MazEF toxin-antitoxin module
MKMVKIRHVGNSDVMTVPPELGIPRGATVMVEKLETGQILVTPAELIRERIPSIAQRLVDEDREALRILEEHDRPV